MCIRDSSWKILTPLSIAVLILTALIGKLIPEGGMARFSILLAANLLLGLTALILFNLQRRRQPLKKFPLVAPGGFAVKDISSRRSR